MHENNPQKRASGPRREAAGPHQGRSRVPRAPRPLDRQAGRLDVGRLQELQARMVEIAGEFIKANPTAMDLARREYRDEQCNARRERIAQLRADIDKLSAELTALEQES